MSERLNSGFIRVAAACAAISTAGAVHGQTVFYVDDDAPSGGDGRSWDTALNDLQDALWAFRVLSESVEIRIAGGTYLPSQTLNDDEAFDLAHNSTQSGMTLRIHGGFRGLAGGGDPNERDLSQFLTILSGDLNGDDQPGFINYDDNSQQVIRVQLSYSPDSVVLDGVTIRGAKDTGLYVRSRAGHTLRVTDCTLMENLGHDGGAAAVRSQVEFASCLFLGNRAWNGGAVNLDVEPRDVGVVNCSFIGNRAGWGTAVVAEVSGLTIRNSIFADTGSSQAVVGLAAMSYSIFQEFYPGDGNLVGDPLFVDPSNGDYRLRADSPCIDAGDTKYVSSTGPLDLFGQPRVVDDPIAPNTGVGDYGYIDMGMLEYQGCDGDLNDDGLLNSQDLLTFLNRLAEGCR